MIVLHLDELIKKRNISKSQLAKQTGISRNTIYLITNDKTKSIEFDTLDKLCRALECSVGDIIEYIPD